MAKSNYEIMKDQMQLEFLKYDQSTMIEKFGLQHDEAYIYIQFVGYDYRVNRHNGKVECLEDGFAQTRDADYNEAMSIFDVLCYSKVGCHLSGRFSTVNNLKGVAQSAGLGNRLFDREARYFDQKPEQLSRACEAIGGVEQLVGDVSYSIPVFSFLPMVLQFWDSDEEFPAHLKFMWDENVLDYMHYETTYYVMAQVLHRLREYMEK